jgi:hypothetical protein
MFTPLDIHQSSLTEQTVMPQLLAKIKMESTYGKYQEVELTNMFLEVIGLISNYFLKWTPS